MAIKPVKAPDLTHISLEDHSTVWDEYAKVALAALLSFHGSDGSAANSGIDHVAEIADAMVAARMARIGAAKEAIQAEKDAKRAGTSKK